MCTRRQFLLQTTVAGASYVFSKQLKDFAISPVNTLKFSDKLSILNVNNFESILRQPSANSSYSSLTQFEKASKVEMENVLLLGTGNIIGKETCSKIDHKEKLNWLKRVGCDAFAPDVKDLEKGAEYYNELADECSLTSLLAVKTNNNGLLPYHLIRKGNIKVGMIGINSPLDDNLTIPEIAEKLDTTAAILKTRDRCHLIVCINPYQAHNSETSQRNKDKEIAALTKKVDVIITNNNTAKDAVTYIVRNALRHEVLINYPGRDNAVLKGLDISFNNQIKKVNVSLRPVA